MLCIGGPCKYVVRADTGVTYEFILRHVMSSVNRRIADEVCIILGKAMLFFIFGDTTNHLPEDIFTCVKNTCAGVTNDVNQAAPAVRFLIVCTGHKDEVYIDTIASDE